MARTRRPIEQRYDLYPTARECAEAAAPLFAREGWRWTTVGVPSELDILRTLRTLEGIATRDDTDEVESGRLIYAAGRYGHEKATRPPA